jgi:hypothetical protein
VLAIVAAAIDAFARRRARPTAVTLTSPSGFMTPPSSHLRGAVVGVGSNEFTSIRPIATEPVQPLSESGSRT